MSEGDKGDKFYEGTNVGQPTQLRKGQVWSMLRYNQSSEKMKGVHEIFS